MTSTPLTATETSHGAIDFRAASSSSFRARTSNFQSLLPTYTPNGIPRRTSPNSKDYFPSAASMAGVLAWYARRLASRPVTWLLVLIITLSYWWGNGGGKEWQSADFKLRLREYLPPEITKDLAFFPASHHRIHFVGRWTTAPNRMRIDGAFPGVYFDLNVTNTSTIVLSLQNTKAATSTSLKGLATDDKVGLPAGSLTNQYSFSAASRLRVGAPPISLLALVDQEEYIVLPNATGLSSIRMKDLDPNVFHSVRVVAPMTDNDGRGVLQLDGVWLDKSGQLFPVEGSIADTINDEMDDFDAESDQIGVTHRTGLAKLFHGENAASAPHRVPPVSPEEIAGEDSGGDFHRRKKLVEIVTDDPANFRGRKQRSARSGGADGLLAGVMGWEYLLGEMFSVDHVCIGVEGQCLMKECIGGTGSPTGIGDVFFRSGPVESPHFGHPWLFQSYQPDVLIFNIGASDYYSIRNRQNEYNLTGGELFRAFEDTYVTLIKSIRTMAYPNHPATIEMQRLGVDAYAENNSPATIPIFIMRPFGGELEWATQGAVNRLRAEGDKGVFWLDTSGWLDFEGTETRSPDVFLDKSFEPARYHLTERGNQKVAIYLHMHVCRYLASAEDTCAFLPPEVYQGQVFDASVATFERYIENEKERQIREMFWENDDDIPAKDGL